VVALVVSVMVFSGFWLWDLAILPWPSQAVNSDIVF